MLPKFFVRPVTVLQKICRNRTTVLGKNKKRISPVCFYEISRHLSATILTKIVSRFFMPESHAAGAEKACNYRLFRPGFAGARDLYLFFKIGADTVIYKENNKVIGSLGLHKSWANDESQYAHLKIKEVGYVLSKAYWGKG